MSALRPDLFAEPTAVELNTDDGLIVAVTGIEAARKARPFPAHLDADTRQAVIERESQERDDLMRQLEEGDGNV